SCGRGPRRGSRARAPCTSPARRWSRRRARRSPATGRSGSWAWGGSATSAAASAGTASGARGAGGGRPSVSTRGGRGWDERNRPASGRRGRVTFLRGDRLEMPLPPVAAIFFDPSRRTARRRRLAVRDYRPPLDTVRRWLSRVPALGVKLAPGVDRADLAGYDA